MCPWSWYLFFIYPYAQDKISVSISAIYPILLFKDNYKKNCNFMIFTKFYRSDQQRALESVVIGAVARTNAVVTLIPITVLKTRYEVCISRMTVYCHYSDH